MRLYPQNATSREHAPTPSPSVVFTFGLTIESIKELGGASCAVGLCDCPFAFNVFLDFIVKKALRALPDYGVEVDFWSRGELGYTPGSRPLSFATIIVLLYADDMVIFNTDVGKLMEMLKVVDFWASEMAMRINVAKTKIMLMGKVAVRNSYTPSPLRYALTKTRSKMELLCSCSLTSKVVQGK
jgi:hypothetical protein